MKLETANFLARSILFPRFILEDKKTTSIPSTSVSHSTKSSPAYAYSNASDDEYIKERERLAYFDPLHKEKTISFLEKQGVADAETFADIGAGTAFMASALAQKYPSLKVTAFDKDEKHIDFNRKEFEDLENLEFYKYDLMQPSGKLANSFDMVNSTLVMAHMAEPQAAVDNMLKLVKPGGVLTAEEVDISSLKTNKACPAFDKFKQLWGDVIQSINCDAQRGVELEQLFKRAGLQNVKASFYLTKEPQDKVKDAILGVVEKKTVQQLLLNKALVQNQDEIEELILDLKQAFSDSELEIDFYRMYQVSGKKASS